MGISRRAFLSAAILAAGTIEAGHGVSGAESGQLPGSLGAVVTPRQRHWSVRAGELRIVGDRNCTVVKHFG